jgi:hypothetical protein
MKMCGVSEHDAKVRSGRSTRSDSRASYIQDQASTNTNFKIGCCVMIPRVMRDVQDPAPVLPIPTTLMTNPNSGILITHASGWRDPINTGNIQEHH